MSFHDPIAYERRAIARSIQIIQEEQANVRVIRQNLVRLHCKAYMEKHKLESEEDMAKMIHHVMSHLEERDTDCTYDRRFYISYGTWTIKFPDSEGPIHEDLSPIFEEVQSKWSVRFESSQEYDEFYHNEFYIH